ncbi:protein TolQ [Sphingomonas lacunae]|uniref:Protein TolQ n=1 Tax=Sphingomonas lacunae TaxID=2698828 RepID=A0A6M4AST7_9SPHN|nr:protein TolQ [Sphingomonas lacunae]QJQ31129.1 protein TolQ [Sphingomonas lacunae]
MNFPSISLDPASMSPLALFLQADFIVKSVMIGLLLASIWTWMIIIGNGRRLSRIRKDAEAFERDFWRASDVDRFSADAARTDSPSARILNAGLGEWRRSTARPVVDRAGVRERIAAALDSAIGMEMDRLGERLNTLATIGSVAPFVGLFGTVWGIMRSFSGIASAGNSSLAVVAPGIAEALFATAIGLFAAIPAVIAYNRFTYMLGKIESRLLRFSDGFHAMLSRELERDA